VETLLAWPAEIAEFGPDTGERSCVGDESRTEEIAVGAL